MNRIFGHVPEIWKGGKRIATLGGVQEMLCLTEQGLYFFLGRSDKPNALPYQMWIASEVVPSIRKHGAYMTPQTIEDLLAEIWRGNKRINTPGGMNRIFALVTEILKGRYPIPPSEFYRVIIPDPAHGKIGRKLAEKFLTQQHTGNTMG